MTKFQRQIYTEEFEREVHVKARQVDPSNEQDWYSITLGWAIAKGMSPRVAHTFATYIRYETELA